MTTKAVILAAGRGTRMMPMTSDKPKPMIDVAERPFIDHLLERVYSAGIEDIALIVGYKKGVIERYLEEHHDNVTTIHQEEPLGTGHAVLCAEDFVGDDDFIVLMGDNLYSERDIRWISSFNQHTVGALTAEEPERYGVLETDGHRLAGLIEKPENPPSNLVNAALYKFTPEIFDSLKEVTRSPRGEYELTDAVNELSLGEGVFVYRLTGDWLDFGRPEDIPQAEARLSS